MDRLHLAILLIGIIAGYAISWKASHEAQGCIFAASLAIAIITAAALLVAWFIRGSIPINQFIGMLPVYVTVAVTVIFSYFIGTIVFFFIEYL